MPNINTRNNGVIIIGNANIKKYESMTVKVEASAVDPLDDIVKEAKIELDNNGMVVGDCYKLKIRAEDEGATIGNLNFMLEWFDGNDLDLHVECPCKSHICFQNRKCEKCGAFLDVDMNALGDVVDDINVFGAVDVLAHGVTNKIHPVEHVFADKLQKGNYYFYVDYFARHGGPVESQFILTLFDENACLVAKYEGKVSTGNRYSQKYLYVFPPQQ